MKKNIIYLAGISVVLVIGSVIYFVVDRFKTYDVTFKLDQGISSIEVTGGTSSSTIKNGQTLKLSPGEYQYKLLGADMSLDKVSFRVDKSEKTIEVPVVYNTSYLDKLSVDLKPTIEQLLASKYPEVMSRYRVYRLVFFSTAEWGGVVLAPKDIDPANPEGVYRAVLKLDGDKWMISGTPQIALTKFTNSDVSVDILTKINNLPLY